MDSRPSYGGVFRTFARNSLIRDMAFRGNFLIQCLSSLSWVLMNLGFYILIFQYSPERGLGNDWGQYEFFVFLSTTYFVNSLVQAFFMPNCEEFSELIRTGGLDFALVKPIDTQFLISLRRVNWSAFTNFGFGVCLLVFSLKKLSADPNDPLIITPLQIGLYVFYILCGVLLMYSLMISLASTSVWLGRNQSLYNFWFYLTNFSRYPMEIYSGNSLGDGLRGVFTFVVPVLVVVNVPARMLVWPIREQDWTLAGYALFATIASLVISRRIFVRSLLSYRSASS